MSQGVVEYSFKIFIVALNLYEELNSTDRATCVVCMLDLRIQKTKNYVLLQQTVQFNLTHKLMLMLSL